MELQLMLDAVKDKNYKNLCIELCRERLAEASGHKLTPQAFDVITAWNEYLDELEQENEFSNLIKP